MFTIGRFPASERYCSDVLRKARWGDSEKATCPRCHFNNTKKDGLYRKVYQKYYCYDCERWFNVKTGTLFHYSRTPLNKWFLAIYMFFVLWTGCSMNEISSELLIPYERCYHFIRTMMELILIHSVLKRTKLKGNVEIDELYKKAGLKGRSYQEEIRKLGRKPRRRALKAPKGRGTFEKDYPMVVSMHERGGPTIFDVPINRQIMDIVCSNVQYGSNINTDDYAAYDSLSSYGFSHESVNHSEKEYARGDAHVNNCEGVTNLYRIWESKFMGINKNNLQAYSKTIEFVLNSRKEIQDRGERFMQVLSYALSPLAETYRTI